jgi:acetyl-CoA C-acetyltransferase
MGDMLFDQTAIDKYLEIEESIMYMPVTHPELLMAPLMLIGSKEIGEKLGLKPRA